MGEVHTGDRAKREAFEWNAFFGALLDDVERLRLLAAERGEQTLRRAYVRAVGTVFDGATLMLKAKAVRQVLESRVEVSRAELALLMDEAYELNDQGMPRTRVRLAPAAAGAAFAFKTFVRVHGLGIDIDLGGDGWRAFVEASRVRNRVTHPKGLEDLNVSDDDLASVNRAFVWHTATQLQISEARIRQIESAPS